MKTYSDLTDIDTHLNLILQLEPVGTPEMAVVIDNHYAGGKIFKPVEIKLELGLLKTFCIEIELKNKIYDAQTETAIKIKSLQIDGIDLVPRFDYMASYENDHSNNNATSYLGFNGKWRLTIDRPFYQWLHQATTQGWLIS